MHIFYYRYNIYTPLCVRVCASFPAWQLPGAGRPPPGWLGGPGLQRQGGDRRWTWRGLWRFSYFSYWKWEFSYWKWWFSNGVWWYTPQKSNIDTKNLPCLKGPVIFSKAHHFGYPCEFSGVYIDVRERERERERKRSRYGYIMDMYVDFIYIYIWVYTM